MGQIKERKRNGRKDKGDVVGNSLNFNTHSFVSTMERRFTLIKYFTKLVSDKEL